MSILEQIRMLAATEAILGEIRWREQACMERIKELTERHNNGDITETSFNEEIERENADIKAYIKIAEKIYKI